MQTAYILINCQHGKSKLVSKRLEKLEEIKEIHEIFGLYDIIVKVEAEDVIKLKEFLQNKITIIEDIKKTNTLLASDDYEKQVIPFEGDEEDEEELF